MNELLNNKSVIVAKSYQFALDIIKVQKDLSSKREYVLSKQLLRSGTSIGANINEATASPSKKDFVNKLSIASKEARESLYWLNLLHDTGFIDQQSFQLLSNKSNELLKILSSIILTIREKYLLKEDEEGYVEPNS